jgi:hypothetical protein
MLLTVQLPEAGSIANCMLLLPVVYMVQQLMHLNPLALFPQLHADM